MTSRFLTYLPIPLRAFCVLAAGAPTPAATEEPTAANDSATPEPTEAGGGTDGGATPEPTAADGDRDLTITPAPNATGGDGGAGGGESAWYFWFGGGAYVLHSPVAGQQVNS